MNRPIPMLLPGWTVGQPVLEDRVRLEVDAIVARAGIRAGTWRWIRRGSGTDVEIQVEGAGHRHLGNTAAVFEQSYGDQSLIGRRTPCPRELLVQALACESRKATGGGHSKNPPDSVSRRAS